MWSAYDEDEHVTVVSVRPCTNCDGRRGCTGRCNGSSGISTVRRDPAEVVAIKAARRVREEDEIVARAREILARRGSAPDFSAAETSRVT